MELSDVITEKTRERMLSAQVLLSEHHAPKDVARQLGYNSTQVFYARFKHATGVTVDQFRDPSGNRKYHMKKQYRLEKIETAKDMMLKGYSTSDVLNATGYSFPQSFYQAFKNQTGMTIREWKEMNV